MARTQAEKPKRPYVRRKPAVAPVVNGDDSAAPQEAKSRFKYELDAQATISQSGESGVIRARGEWSTGNIVYFVAYTSASGEFKEAWIDEDLLTPFAERRGKRPAKK